MRIHPVVNISWIVRYKEQVEGWDDGKFEEEYLRKLERNWQKWKTVSLEEKPEREDNVKSKEGGLYLFSLSVSFQFIFHLSIFRTQSQS